jgi:hypothetical protein
MSFIVGPADSLLLVRGLRARHAGKIVTIRMLMSPPELFGGSGAHGGPAVLLRNLGWVDVRRLVIEGCRADMNLQHHRELMAPTPWTDLGPPKGSTSLEIVGAVSRPISRRRGKMSSLGAYWLCKSPGQP